MTPDQCRRGVACILARGVLRMHCMARAKRIPRTLAPKAPPTPAGPATVATIKVSPGDRLPMPGAVITRRYKGQSIEVRVLPHGFEREGEVYRTPSAVAWKVTGTHCNGDHFFRLGQKGPEDGHTEA